jgi:hypothetical protein
VMYFVTNTLEEGSLLQRFFDGDDEFRNSRLKLMPGVPKVCFQKHLRLLCCTLQLPFASTNEKKRLQGSWIVRQSVGSSSCILGKAVDCSYVRGPGYLEVSNVFFSQSHVSSNRMTSGTMSTHESYYFQFLTCNAPLSGFFCRWMLTSVLLRWPMEFWAWCLVLSQH